MEKYNVIKDSKGDMYLILDYMLGDDYDPKPTVDAINTKGEYGYNPLTSHLTCEDYSRCSDSYDEALKDCCERSNAELLSKMSIKEFVDTYVTE